MGSGASNNSKTIHIQYDGKTQKVVFSSMCASQDMKDLLLSVAGLNGENKVSLKTQDGTMVVIEANIPMNTASNPYILMVKPVVAIPNAQDTSLEKSIYHVAEKFTSVLDVSDLKTQVTRRLDSLESKLEMESMKTVELQKLQQQISLMRDEFNQRKQKNIGDEGEPIIRVKDRQSTVNPIPDYPKYTLTKETMDYMKEPKFNIWHWEPHEMLCLLEYMYYDLGLVQEFNINPITLKRWLLKVQDNYRNNPFHNFRHCFCVAQMMYGLYYVCNLNSIMSKLDAFVMITSAICHDLDHPGYNNAYQINARTELAIRYNDMSPLENHHCSVAFQILSQPEYNILANTDKEIFKKIRQDMVMLILATDMARHGDIIEGFKTKIETGFDLTNEEHLKTLKMIMIKCCDISNEVRPMEVSAPWVDCLLEEFFNQSDREKAEGLPVAPFMDRDKVTKSSAQIGFIKFVLLPLFENFAKVFAKVEVVLVKPLKDALEHYENLKKKRNPILRKKSKFDENPRNEELQNRRDFQQLNITMKNRNWKIKKKSLMAESREQAEKL